MFPPLPSDDKIPSLSRLIVRRQYNTLRVGNPSNRSNSRFLSTRNRDRIYKFQCTITIAVGIIITKEFKRFYLIKRNGMLHLQLGTICTRHVTRIVGCVGAASLTPTRIATCRPVQRNSNFPPHSLNIHCTR